MKASSCEATRLFFYMQLVMPSAVANAVKNVSATFSTFFHVSVVIFIVLFVLKRFYLWVGAWSNSGLHEFVVAVAS